MNGLTPKTDVAEHIERSSKISGCSTKQGQRLVWPETSPSLSEFDQHGIAVLYDSAICERAVVTEPDVLSIVSHELLSPLSLIKGYAATLLELGDVISDGQKRRYLQSIDSAADRIVHLVENMRDLGRMEDGDSLLVRPTNVGRLIRRIVSDMQRQTTRHIVRPYIRGFVPKVKVDQRKIEQVMTNLLVNAIKYSPRGGDIDVEASKAECEDDIEEAKIPPFHLTLPCLIVSVSDRGIGIPEEELGKLFRRYYRVNSISSRTIPGVGLGLHVCKGIVSAHGGQIWARSRVGGGTVFCFSLPLDN